MVRHHPLVGISEMDREHAELFRLVRELHDSLAGTAGGSEAPRLWRELARHATDHFSHEEREMRSVGYAQLEWHASQHRVAQGTVRKMGGRFCAAIRVALFASFAGWPVG